MFMMQVMSSRTQRSAATERAGSAGMTTRAAAAALRGHTVAQACPSREIDIHTWHTSAAD